ncbi:MAG: RecX family transcriptional regulator [Ktedonobacteraceae bacterium]|nr:RecX family transcriptional regulator [Ktedonobacteraceae bacterium]MBO0789743.1 RecX family transcriptional regulator [Ktedonobacteraceae bacterium]
MRITALQPQVNNPDRVNVAVDGQFLLGVHALLVYQMGLKVDQELTPEQLAQLREGEAQQQAVERALGFLALRPRSREEIRRYLRRKDTPSELIDAVLERLEQLELVNDRDFTTFWVESRDRFSPRGARALKSELRMKGVKREVVDELVSSEQDEERVEEAARKKAQMLARQPGMDYTTFARRLGSFLQRRGFNYDITTRTVRALWKELREETPGEDDVPE